jgi:hypothetical protein
MNEITQDGVTASNRMGRGQRSNKGGMKAQGNKNLHLKIIPLFIEN